MHGYLLFLHPKSGKTPLPKLREINKKQKNAHADHAQAENQKRKGALEVHHGGDTEKGLAMDGGLQIGAEKTGDTVPKNKHKQEKNGKQ